MAIWISIKQLINSHEINIHTENEKGFRMACNNGHKHIVELKLVSINL
jgi:hypothetical protein